MLNQVVFIGRLVRDPELRESEGGKKYTNITLAVTRSYKNPDGDYGVDFIDCRLWTGVAENTAESGRQLLSGQRCPTLYGSL